MSHLRPGAPVGSKARLLDPSYYVNDGPPDRSLIDDYNYGPGNQDAEYDAPYEPYAPSNSAPTRPYGGRNQKARKLFSSNSLQAPDGGYAHGPYDVYIDQIAAAGPRPCWAPSGVLHFAFAA